MVGRLQITLLAASEVITCHLLIIPETRFLPFGELLPPAPLPCGNSFLLPQSLGCLSDFFPFLYRSIGMGEKTELHLSIRELPLFS